MVELTDKSIQELLATHVSVMDKLYARGILRSANNPTGDLAEYLFCKAFGWHQAPNSQKGFDATDTEDNKYQIKSRRLHNNGKSRQLSAIRDLEGFDFLAAVLFDHSYNITKAVLIPVQVVKKLVKYREHVNAHILILNDSALEELGVDDVTDNLKAVYN